MLRKFARRFSVLFVLVAALPACEDDGSNSNVSIPAPNAPSGVTATPLSTGISVSWNAVSEADGYIVYWSGSANGEYQRFSGFPKAGTSYIDDGCGLGETRYYRVSAIRGSITSGYVEGAKSSYASATAGASVPSTPSNVTATTVSSSSIRVSWSAVSGATEYYVYRATSGSGSYIQVGTSSSTPWTDTGLSTNTAYYYKVSAYNSYGEGAQSSYASAATSGAAPIAPSNITATATSSSSITISWSSVSGATEYYVYRATSSSGSYSYRGSSTSTSYTDTGLPADAAYYYKVSAYNSYGEGAQSSYASATTSGTAPTAPSNVTASATSSSSITVSWSSVSGATDYYVYRATSSNGSYSYRGSSTSTSYTDTGLSTNTTYYYKVAAYNSYGTSAQSTYAYAATSGFAPSPPSGLTATTASSSSITVSWSAVSGATDYYVYRATSSNGTYSHRGSSNSTSYTDTGLYANTTYYYKVAAYNSYGEGAQSSYAYTTTSVSAPSDMTAEATSSSRITVSWSSVTGATGYYIYRSTSSNGSYSYRGASTSSSYTDTGLSANTVYFYKVAAYNSYGESAQSSSIGAITWASTSPPPLYGSPLIRNTWEEGEIFSPSDTQYYYFYATSGSSYTVFWNSDDGGDGTYDGWVKVSAYWYSSNEDIFYSEDSEYSGGYSGYYFGRTFTATKTGYVILDVSPYYYNSYGTHAIMYQ